MGSSSNQRLTLMNSSAAVITITQAVASGGGFTVEGPSLPLTLAEGQSATFTARFAPPGIGDASGSLLITKSQVTTPQLTGGSGSATPSITTKLETITMAAAGVPAMPSITTQPASQTVSAGQTATFSITASGAAPLSYQWRKNGTAISGATLSAYTTPATVTSDSGLQLTVLVSNSAGNVTSNAATLTVNATPVAITVNPSGATVAAGSTQQFAGNVTGTANTGMTWSVSGAGCNGAACGTISTNGLYVPPTNVPTPATVTVKATSTADPTKSASASLTIVAAAAVLLSISPTSASVATVGTQLFTASVTGTTNTAVTWSLSGAGCSGSSCGTISTSASSAVYSAPTVAPAPASVSVTANSVADPTKSASASVTIVPVIAVTVNPPNASVPTGTTQQFNASVTGTSNTALAWSVTGAGCSGVACGTINSGGLYAASAAVPSPPTVTVTATSVADPKKSGAVNLTIIGSGTNGPALPTLPQAFVSLTMPTQGGSACPTLTTGSNCIRTPRSGNATDFKNAINAATCGDTIILAAGSTYSGNFTIPATSCSGWILIQSSALSSLPASGNRVGPSNVSHMAIISTPNTAPAVEFLASSNHWRLIGLEITTSYASTGNTVYNLVLSDGNSLTSLAGMPSYVIFDRCYIVGLSNANVTRGIDMDIASFGIVGSYCDEIHSNGQDSQCFAAFNGPGPYLIQNNFIQAAGENIMFGGADPAITNLVPSDITIVGNLIQKNQTWKGEAAPYNWVVKNLLELKNAQRVLLDGNVLQYTWAAGQAEAIIFRSVNQGGTCTWCVVQDVTVIHNLIQHAPMGVVLVPCAGPLSTNSCVPTGRILIQNNLLDDISAANWGGPGRGFQVSVDPSPPLMSAITIDHNTVFDDTDALYLGDTLTTSQFQYTNMIANYGEYGIIGNGVGSGTVALKTFAPDYIYKDMVFINANGTVTGTYPTGTFWNTSSGVGFTNYSGANYQLTTGSPYHNAGTDGKDIGVWDWTTFNTDTSNALNGIFIIN